VKAIKFVSNNVKLNVSHNNITEIIGFLELHEPDPIVTKRTTLNIYLQNNAINCNCESFYLFLHQRFKFGPHEVNVKMDAMNQSGICETEPFYRKSPLKDVTVNDVLCLRGIDCPNKCKCYKRPFNKASVVDCSENNFENVSIPFYMF